MPFQQDPGRQQQEQQQADPLSYDAAEHSALVAHEKWTTIAANASGAGPFVLPYTQEDFLDELPLLVEELQHADKRVPVKHKRRKGRGVIVDESPWEAFHRRHSTRFFPFRHYLSQEFPELCSDEPIELLEVGCGTGSAVLPMLKAHESLHVTAVDISQTAIAALRCHPDFNSSRCEAFVGDPAQDSDPWPWTDNRRFDVVTLIFVLSALRPEEMASLLRNVGRVLKPNGRVLVRDYGFLDSAQFGLAARGGHLDGRLYKRSDGTLAYFFTLDELRQLCQAAGLRPIDTKYTARKLVNRAKGREYGRIWVQGRFQKMTDDGEGS
ncbi:unnamed protein product [Vitrella brassicaformis CCMP3155]|uniref:Methyltransferase-like protein n=1 Tax=Vitrella brassicaformis (strain CCMP3155) TaxID=1169540 RepID=A0A0G4GPX5_VITBC|nr:unnamed protein product [Vitrella brassicaformis CCMP3155]|eukprot:CEM32430.1 unnamed protein product [Vitrella brassicaformis CCMP3155]